MAHVLTWKALNQEQTKRCLLASDIKDIRSILGDIKSGGDTAASGFPFSTERHNDGQARILVDFHAHTILFARSLNMSAAKLSSLVGIFHEVHEASMSQRLSRPASYNVLRALVVQHSVARPPYAAAIFSLEDVRAIDEYVMATYYRHYKMYYFAFVPKQTATIRVAPLGALTEVPPSDLPPLSAAIAEDEWKKKVEAKEQVEETARMEEMLHESEALEEQRLRQSDLNDPRYAAGIKEQLESIRNAVLAKSSDRLQVLEEQLTAIEAKVDEAFSRSRPASKSISRKK